MVSTISSGEFARIFSVRGPRIGWFLGAGSSASAGIPTGYDMILDFKARLFTEATNLSLKEVDPSDPLWEDRINSYFDGDHGFPSSGHPSEYSVAFAAVYPREQDRRTYIESQVRRGTASFGHRVLATLITAGKVPAVVTTNFDPLVERAAVVTDELMPADQRAHLTTSAIDSAERGERVVAEGAWPLLLKLHGDYQEVALKNTTEELKEQDERQRRTLIGLCAQLGLIVVGYSGRDDSVMEALAEAVDAGGFPAGLFWMCRPGARLLDSVTQLLERAEAAGIETAIVEVSTFDELAGELVRNTELPQALSDHIDAHATRPVVVPVKLPTAEAADFPVLRCSALPVRLPTDARRFQIDGQCTVQEFRDRLAHHNLRRHTAFSLQGNRLVAFGRDADYLQAGEDLGISVAGKVELDPLADSWALGLLVDALAGSLVRGRPLRRRHVRGVHALLATTPRPARPGDEAGKRMHEQAATLRAAYRTDLTGVVPDINLAFAEGVYLRLEHRAEHWWAVYEPFTWVDLPRDPSPEMERIAADWRRERWAQRYNGVWAGIIDAWARLFTGDRPTTVRSTRLDDRAGVAAEFHLAPKSGWSRPAGQLAGDLVGVRA